jgi:hypothetical protein
MTARLSSYILKFLVKKHNPTVHPTIDESERAYNETEFMVLTRKQIRSFDLNIIREIELNMYILELYKDGTYHKSYNKLTKLMKALGVSHEERRKQHFKLFFTSHIKNI